MSFFNFTNDAKNKLDGYRPSIDAEALWEQIEPQLPEQKKKKRFFFWLWSGVFLIGMISLASWYFLSQPKSNDRALVNNPVAPTSIESTAENTMIMEQTSIANSNTINQSEQRITTATTKPSSNGKNSQEINTKSPITSITKTTKPYQSPTVPVDTQTRLPEDEQRIEKRITKTIADLETSPLKNFPTVSQPIKLLALKPILFLESSTELSIPPIKESAEEGINLNRRKNNFQAFLGVHVGGGRLHQNLNLVRDSRNNLLNNRLSTETTLESLYAGLDLQVRHRSGFYFQTGLEYTRMATQFFQDSITRSQLLIEDGIQRIYVNSSGRDSTFVRGTTTATAVTTTTKKRFNNFHILQIPLVAGYQHRYESWFFALEGGVLVSALFKKSGSIADEQGALYDLAKDEQALFKNNLSLQPIVAFQAGHQFSSGWELYLSPQYRLPVKLNTVSSPVEEKLSSLGCTVGIRIGL